MSPSDKPAPNADRASNGEVVPEADTSGAELERQAEQHPAVSGEQTDKRRGDEPTGLTRVEPD